MQNKKGKTITIFIGLITVLLVSSTAIGFFMYQKESQMRKDLEAQLQASQQQGEKLANDLKETKKQMTLLEDKNKEADTKINNLMDEIELNKGVGTALKKENGTLKDSLAAAKKEKDAIRADLDMAAKKLQESQALLTSEQEKTRDLLTKVDQYEDQIRQQEAKAQEIDAQSIIREVNVPSGNKMELGRIIIGQQEDGKGRIISIDKDSDFVICNLGVNQGVRSGDMLSVYRGDKYLGDLKVSRAQEDMSAADFVPPLSSHKTRKNDIVVPKRS